MSVLFTWPSDHRTRTSSDWLKPAQPKSYMATVSKSIEMFLEMQRMQLIEGDVWGHRKDINEYYTIPSSVIEKIKEMKIEGKSSEDIETKVSRESKLNPGMVAYIMTKESPA
jgi:Protein of unknown function (DUF1699)